MKQAKVINETEMKLLLAVIDAAQHAERNRSAVMLSYLAGLRVGEIAALKIGDVFDDDGNPRDQILLKAAYTKGNHARTVFVSKRLSKELMRFRNTLGDLPGVDKRQSYTKMTFFKFSTSPILLKFVMGFISRIQMNMGCTAFSSMMRETRLTTVIIGQTKNLRLKSHSMLPSNLMGR